MRPAQSRLMIFLTGLVLALGRIGAAPAESEPGGPPWKDEKLTSDGLAISTRRHPGTGLYEVRASCALAVAPVTVFAVAMQRETYRTTTKYMVEYRLLEDGDRVWYTYERLSFPLFRERDYTVRHEVVTNEPGQRYVIRWTLANDRGPKARPGVIRVAATEGALEISREPGGIGTRIVCSAVADPGGWIPNWATNLANRSTVPDLLRAIRTKSLATAQTAKP